MCRVFVLHYEQKDEYWSFQNEVTVEFIIKKSIQQSFLFKFCIIPRNSMYSFTFISMAFINIFTKKDLISCSIKTAQISRARTRLDVKMHLL